MDIVLIDPGHGGSDPGVTHPHSSPWEIAEKDITLTLARKLRQALNDLDWPIAAELTREDDEDMSLATRGRLAHKFDAALVIALHVNSAPEPETSGMITFARSGDYLGASVARTITLEAPPELRRKANIFFSCDALGISTDPEQHWLARANNVLSAYAPIPTVLVECGHMTNESDRKELQSDSVQQGIVNACILGVEHFLTISGPISAGRRRDG